jgi:hypothetical protein
MALTVDELAYLVDSAVQICVENEVTGALALTIAGLQIRIGAGPELQDVEGSGLTYNAARNNYASKVNNQVVVVGGNPRGTEVRVPTTVIGFEPTGETGA